MASGTGDQHLDRAFEIASERASDRYTAARAHGATNGAAAHAGLREAIASLRGTPERGTAGSYARKRRFR